MSEIQTTEPSLLEIAHKINALSSQLDGAIAEYRQMAKQYNQASSELNGGQVFPISMNLSSLPCVVTQAGRKFNLKLGMRKIGTSIEFVQQPQPYIPDTVSNEPTIETKLLLQQDFVVKMQQFRSQVPAWDKNRLAVYSDQISEAERLIQKLLQEQEKTA